MTIVGFLLLVAGIGIFGLIFTGNAPEQLAALNAPLWAWLVLAGVGLLLIMLNRRPAD